MGGFVNERDDNSIIRPLIYPAIDGLRFYGAALIFMVHIIDPIARSFLNLVPTPRGTLGQRALYFLQDGHHGVDLFFIISGFLIGRMLLKKTICPSTYATFAARRFRRIYPAFFASFIACTVLWCSLGYLPFSIKSFAADLIFLNMIHQLDIVAYNWVSWSLGYEFIFYLSLPLFIAAWRRSPVLAFTGLAVITMLCFSFDYPRVIGLMIGTFIATRPDDELRSAEKRLPLIGVLLFYGGVQIVHGFVPMTFAIHYPLLMAGLVGIFLKTTFSDGLLNKIMKSRPLRFLGTVSFSFYLWHPVAIQLAILTVPHRINAYTHIAVNSAIVMATAFILAVAIAYASYLLFERSYFSERRQIKNAVPVAAE